VMAMLNVVLNLILIPPLGFLGAALAALAAFTVGAALSWWFGRAVALYPHFAREALKAAIALVSLVITLRLVFSAAVLEGMAGGVVAAALRMSAGIAVFGAVAWLLDLSQLRSGLVRRPPPALDPTP